jgi:hypothetical protein
MKEHLAELVRQTATPAQSRNLAREYLQARILAALQRAGAMIPLAFHGGTACVFSMLMGVTLRIWIWPWKATAAATISTATCKRFEPS